MMGERQAAEDLVQEVFLKVWRGAGGYRAERGSVRTWLLSIVRNRGVDLLRARASRRRTQDKIEASATLSEPSEAFGEHWLNTRRDQVREALKTLPQGLPIWDANHVGRLGRKEALASSAVGGLLPAGPADPLPAETNRN